MPFRSNRKASMSAPGRPPRLRRGVRNRVLWLALAGALALAGGCDPARSDRAEALRWSAADRLGGLRIAERSAMQAPAGAERTLTVAATGNLNGWITTDTLYPERPATGLAHLAPLLRDLRADDPDLILLDAGDALHGAPSATLHAEGSALPALDLPIVPLMNALHYDAMALGNFDLALGWAALAHAEAAADFRWLSANLERGEGGTRLPPYRVLERGGVRVGIVGLTTADAALGRDPRQWVGLRFADLERTARRWVRILREVERVDVLIGLLHSGLESEYGREAALRSGLPLPNAVGRVARTARDADAGRGFDLIVAGAAWRLAPRASTIGPTPQGVPTLEPGARGVGIAVARLHLQAADGRWRVRAVERHTLAAADAPAADLLAVAEPRLRSTRQRLAEPTAVRFRAMPRKGEFYRCAGALSHAAATFLAGDPAALSLLPLRWDFLPPRRDEMGAPLRRAHLYRWMRYGDPLVQGSLTGRQVALLLDGYVRHERGWSVPPLAVLWPGGLAVQVPREGSELTALRLAADRRPLEANARVPVWLTSFLWYGGLGIAQQALLPAGALLPGGAPLREQPVTVRAGLFALLSDPAAPIPTPCARWLEH